jgi:hypothetical protein
MDLISLVDSWNKSIKVLDWVIELGLALVFRNYSRLW